MKHKIIFKALVGSQSQGLATPESDEDYTGVYVQDIDDIITFDYEEYVQINKDEKYFEIRRFLELLMKANPSAIELLFTPEDCIIQTTPQFELLREYRNVFLTKKCYHTFANYAKSQVNKSLGTDKKINWEQHRFERKTPLDFVFVEHKGKTMPINIFLENRGWVQENCGIVKLNHFENGYGLYYDTSGDKHFRGIVGQNGNEIRTSSIDKEFADNNECYVIYYNKDGYSTHCKDYQSYQTWLKERNTNRYHTNVSHGQIYDSKNVCNLCRLRDISREIVETGTFSVRRPNREYLLSVKRGELPLDKIIVDVESDMREIETLYKNSNLPDEVDPIFVKDLLLKIRKM